MYCELKNEQYWVWSSRKASLDCMPQYKFKALEQLSDKILSISKIKTEKIKKNKVDRKIAKQRKVYEKSQRMRNERLYSWAASLN